MVNAYKAVVGLEGFKSDACVSMVDAHVGSCDMATIGGARSAAWCRDKECSGQCTQSHRSCLGPAQRPRTTFAG